VCHVCHTHCAADADDVYVYIYLCYTQVVPLVEGWAQGTRSQRITAKGDPFALYHDVYAAVECYLTNVTCADKQ
jgi:hypothetical protein